MRNNNGSALKIIWVPLLLVVGLVFLFSMAYTVDTGNVAVEKTLGKVDLQEKTEGIQFKMPFLTSAREYSAKVIAVDLENLTPKASDNLSLRDLDITIFYSVARDRIAELSVKYAASEVEGKEAWWPAYQLVWREARSVVYDSVSEIPSLQLHKQRESLQMRVQEDLATRLEEKDPGVFLVDRVVIRALNTDPTIEKAIQQAVQNEKRLEAKKVEVEIAAKDAEIEIKRAEGIARANEIINESLTPEYLQHEFNLALMKSAENGNQMMVVPANMQGLITLDPKRVQMK
ncbi:MAG: SPFH domain-containing protein [Alcanivoracaceae bacterium]|nr:SPFH domain-containing protein [Alcanivoracaceae bacterium]